VSNYLTNHPPPYTSYSTTNDADIGAGGGIYNRNGRGYPDVSAIGDNVLIFNKGAPTLIGGTSAAAPVFAAILTRINEERLKAGMSTVGFVNPTLYANPGAFHDITTGNNPGCNTNGFSYVSSRLYPHMNTCLTYLQCCHRLGSCHWTRHSELPCFAQGVHEYLSANQSARRSH